jgi:hypothetical protein
MALKNIRQRHKLCNKHMQTNVFILESVATSFLPFSQSWMIYVSTDRFDSLDKPNKAALTLSLKQLCYLKKTPCYWALFVDITRLLCQSLSCKQTNKRKLLWSARKLALCHQLFWLRADIEAAEAARFAARPIRASIDRQSGERS